MDINKEVGNKVRQAIENKNQSILNTSKLAAIAYSTLHRKIEGGAGFTMTELGRLAEVLEVHPSEFMPDSFIQEDAA